MSDRIAEKVLLIGWDAADWQVINPLLDAGQMPFLEMIVNQGVIGNLATLEPALSPMLWTSIATGKRADQHGVLGFIEPDPTGKGVRPVTSISRNSKALWNILTQRGLRSNVVGWWPSHPAEPINGVMVSNQFQVASKETAEEEWPLPPGAIHPSSLADRLADFRLHPAEVDMETLLAFAPKANEIDQDSDKGLVTLAKLIAETISVHNTATHVMENQPWDLMAVYYDAIDHFGHAFMQYHPPRRPHVNEKRYELYKDVVNAAYRFQDLLLGRMLDLAGEDTTVIVLSDHGFQSGELRPLSPRGHGRPGPAAWHRPYGMIAMKGAGIRRDERIYGASLLDITPTVLTLFGLPVGDDMEGQCLMQAFEQRLDLATVPSWEDEEGESGRHQPDTFEDPWDASEALNQMVDLGYIEAPGENIEKAVARVRADRQFNLARVHVGKGDLEKAGEILEALSAQDPDETNFALWLAWCKLELEDFAACRALVERAANGARNDRQRKLDALDRRIELVDARLGSEEAGAAEEDAEDKKPRFTPEQLRKIRERLASRRQALAEQPVPAPGMLDFLLGSVCLGEGKVAEALTHLLQAEKGEPRLPNLHNQIGRAYVGDLRWTDAERAFRRALEIDEDTRRRATGWRRR